MLDIRLLHVADDSEGDPSFMVECRGLSSRTDWPRKGVLAVGEWSGTTITLKASVQDAHMFKLVDGFLGQKESMLEALKQHGRLSRRFADEIEAISELVRAERESLLRDVRQIALHAGPYSRFDFLFFSRAVGATAALGAKFAEWLESRPTVETAEQVSSWLFQSGSTVRAYANMAVEPITDVMRPPRRAPLEHLADVWEAVAGA